MCNSIVIKNIHNKPDLIGLVRSYLKNKKSYSGYYSGYGYDDWDDYYDDECMYARYLYGGRYSPLYRNCNQINRISGSISPGVDDEDDDEDDELTNDVNNVNFVLDTDDEAFKEIYFYDDIQLGDDPDERFSSLKDLREFCDSMGINIPNSLYQSLRTEHIIHCCVNPVEKKYGNLELTTDYSYGNLYWKCMDELEDDYDNGSINSGYFDDYGNFVMPGKYSYSCDDDIPY